MMKTKGDDMTNMLSLLNQNTTMTIRQLVLAHACGKYRPGGKNYRLVRKLIDSDVIFQIGDNLFVKG